ncbi:MAG TPA: nuclear transport factor 2 family protein [Candidatus Polarisedimenticolia bacterium]
MRRPSRRFLPTLMFCAAAVAPGSAGAVAIPVGAVPAPVAAAPAAKPPASAPDDRAAVDKLVADYIGLYTRGTIDRWKELFHPALTVVSPGDDGSIRVRNLDTFFKAQKDRFETGRPVSERLENIRIEPGFRIARVSAEFIFTDDGVSSRGTLGLHLARANDGWKIVAILFSYNPV